MVFFHKTSVILLFFFLGFGVAKHLKFGYSGAFQATDDDGDRFKKMIATEQPPIPVCLTCTIDCVRVSYHECRDICGWEDKPCVCRSLTKAIHCLEACPESPESPDCPDDVVQKMKNQYKRMCPQSGRKLA
ncbi:hypothetical protein Ddc_17028 [Ditylenchus destructor]|nr:hypothetical protein Ddc_17028 [Ditylenchus destructor]